MRRDINLIDPERAAQATEERACSLSDPRAGAFFTANVARWLRRRTDCLRSSFPMEGDPSWTYDAYRKGRPVHRFFLSRAAKVELELLGDWLLGVIDDTHQGGQIGIEAERILNGLKGMSVAEALKKAVAWQWRERKHSTEPPQRGPKGYPTTPLCTIASDDGFVWEKLPVDDLPYLGFDLLNCLRTGKYQREVSMRSMSVWGLRHPHTHRFVVALSTPGHAHTILDVRGFRNAIPMSYKVHVERLMKVLNAPAGSSADVRALGL